MASKEDNKKLKFEVAFASDESPDYPASELNFHSPQTRGWQCPKYVFASPRSCYKAALPFLQILQVPAGDWHPIR